MLTNESPEDGITVVELMIGAALLALVAAMGVGLMSRLQKSAKHDQNKMDNQKLTQSLFNLIKRDAAVQATSGLLPAAAGLTITRLTQGATDESTTYKVTYQSSCQPNANGLFAGSNPALIYVAPHNCLKALNCAAGSAPTVTITLTGTGAASYQQKVYPGFGLCSSAIGDQVQVVLESVFANPSTATPMVAEKVFMLINKTIGDLTVLPN